jgi:pimeloyl-ACP methyl ester carboxylesterase
MPTLRVPPSACRALSALTAVLAFAGAAAAGAPGPGAVALTLSPCVIEHPLRLTVVPAQCGTLSVPENPAAAGGRQIPLHVARVAAISRRREADALFVLAGGPGQAASAFYASVAGAFGRIQRERDIVLIDQRGTGDSNALTCTEDEDRLYEATGPEVAQLTRRCLDDLARRADPAFYTTSLAVADLERVRAALGYEHIDLYGVSYGTRVAQQYLRHFPGRVRAAILDGVVPPQLAIGPDVALDAESALRGILGRCATDAACRARFRDPAHDYQAVRARLAAGAVPLSIADPSGGSARQVLFGPEQLATVLRLGGYSADYAALLPLFLNLGAQGDFTALAAQSLLLTRSYEGIALGMHNSVVCAEDVPFWGAIDRPRLAATFMGAAQVDALHELCRIWPRGPVDQDLHAPLRSAVPTLLLSGGDDPVTPPRYAQLAAAGLSQARQIVLPGFGHGQLTAPCMDRVLADFIGHPVVASLDASCLQRARPMPFFTSVNGPAP